MPVEFQAVHQPCPASLSDQTSLSAWCSAAALLSPPAGQRSATRTGSHQLYIIMTTFAPEKNEMLSLWPADLKPTPRLH